MNKQTYIEIGKAAEILTQYTDTYKTGYIALNELEEIARALLEKVAEIAINNQ